MKFKRPHYPIITKSKLDALLRAGQMCSNVCYNLSQRETLSNLKASPLVESYKAWDAATKALNS